MKHRDILQKVAALAVSGCLILGLSGCGGHPALEAEPNESQTTQEENSSPASNQSQPEEDKSKFIYEDFWTGSWDEIGGRTHMTIAPTTTGYDILISGANGAADMVELRLTGEGNGDGGIACVGEEWNIHYPDGGGDPIETLVDRNCAGTISGDTDHVDIIMYHDVAGKYDLTFVYEGEPLPDPFYDPIEEDDGIPYVDIVANNLGQQYTSRNGENLIVGSNLNHQYLNDLDDVTYYCYFNWDTTDPRTSYEVYGVRDGLIVAYIECFDVDLEPKVRSCLTSDFDGIAPKTITSGIFNYHIWKIGSGYFVCCAYNSGQGYINDEVYTCAVYTDKDICSLLTMN